MSRMVSGAVAAAGKKLSDDNHLLQEDSGLLSLSAYSGEDDARGVKMREAMMNRRRKDDLCLMAAD